MAGNANSGRREKPFYTALLMEIKEAGADNRKLRTIAKVLLEKAESGDMQAMSALMDRLDGRPIQQIEHGGPLDEEGLPTAIQVIIVDPKAHG